MINDSIIKVNVTYLFMLSHNKRKNSIKIIPVIKIC